MMDMMEKGIAVEQLANPINLDEWKEELRDKIRSLNFYVRFANSLSTENCNQVLIEAELQEREEFARKFSEKQKELLE